MFQYANTLCLLSVLECNNKVTRHVAMHTLDSSMEQKLLFSRGSICKIIQDCTKKKCLLMGRQIYSIVFIHGLDSDSFIVDHIIRMFTACGSLVDASEAFYQELNPTTKLNASILHNIPWP